MWINGPNTSAYICYCYKREQRRVMRRHTLNANDRFIGTHFSSNVNEVGSWLERDNSVELCSADWMMHRVN